MDPQFPTVHFSDLILQIQFLPAAHILVSDENEEVVVFSSLLFQLFDLFGVTTELTSPGFLDAGVGDTFSTTDFDLAVPSSIRAGAPAFVNLVSLFT
ncbi:hypothetical protein AMR74_15135 [Halorubrum tropicale]|uniref:Uncharacterized protein n=1 Tax=Halorubrum tropicale TaxID=1765655 RepID=A0A0M9AP55_9EURY|nr:hypothetical protein AMR74_15135 [Halorubrum tropicale]